MADLVTYWTFNENAFSDASGNNCSYGIRGNSPIITDNGKYGKTFYGNSSGNNGGKCNINVSAANVNLNNFSISFWGKQTGANWKDYIGLYASNDIQFQRANNSLDIYGFPWGSITGLNLNLSSGFHHFVLTTDSTTGDANLYVDNVCVKTLNKTDVDTVISYITLGGAYDKADRNGTATVDEVQFYNQPLTAEQVSFLYNNPSLYLATGYQRDVTTDGNWSDSVWNTNGQSGQTFANSSAVQLDAENSPTLTLNQNVTVNSLDFNGSMTIDGSNTITLNGEKRITVAGADDVVTISAPISPLYDNTFTKAGAGTLELTAANTYDGGTTISDGTLKLSGAGTLGTGAVTNSGTLEFNNSTATIAPNISGAGDILVSAGTATLSGAVTQTGGATTLADGTTLSIGSASTLYNLSGGSEGNPASLTVTGDLTLSNDYESTFIGSITAQKITVNTANDIALKLYTGANNKVTADSLTVSSGELDFKGYFSGNIEVFNGSVFSPGNSVGTADITGNITFADATADSNGFALFEFGEYTGEDVNHDLFIMENGGIFTADDGVILLDFAYNDENSWATVGNEFQLVSGGGFEDNVDYNPWLGNMTDLFKLEGRSADGLYLVGIKAAPEPGSGVPEPSTWALLLLGAAGLMYWRKRTRK
ncbi:MAG: autotransporter-associated beta strand repeat-containing protein [Thermoguttaceae bacterium]|nr:autotransporter-associated beta strand repeat-containing protein [Thermoguttaceae bacterium]